MRTWLRVALRTLLGVALLAQGVLGASLWLQGHPHSEGFVALVVIQCFLVLVFLTLFLLTRGDKNVKDAAWIRLLAFLGMAIGLPAVWRLAVWCGAAFIP